MEMVSLMEGERERDEWLDGMECKAREDSEDGSAGELRGQGGL